MTSMKITARIAGLLYLVMICFGMFYLRYVPAKLNVHGNGLATVNNIIASETLFRLGVLAEVIADILFLLLSLTLYKLLHKVNKAHALLMVLFVGFTILISFIDLQNKFAVLTLIGKADYLKVFTTDQLKSHILLYLDFYRNGILTGEIFWGLWLFPLGYLIIKSGFLPKVLGIVLIAGCFGYVANFIGGFLFPHYNDTAISNYVTLPASLGELGLCLWLLIMGVKEKQAQTAAHY